MNRYTEQNDTKYDLSYQITNMHDDSIKKKKRKREHKAATRKIKKEKREEKMIKQCEIITNNIVEDFTSVFVLPKSLKIVSYLYEWEFHSMDWMRKINKRDISFPCDAIQHLLDDTLYSETLGKLVNKRLEIKYPSHLHDQSIFEVSIYGFQGCMDADATDNGLCIKLRDI